MRTLIFDVKGEYAHFKKPYSPMSPVTFPFPPPVAVLGLLGAILGYKKEEYHERLGWERIKIAVRVINPVKTIHAALNLLNTKDGTDAHFRPLAGKNTHIQLPFEFLKDPKFRIYATDMPDSVHETLKESLESGKTVFTPVLGLAQCIADIKWVGEREAVHTERDRWTMDSVCPLDEGPSVKYEDGRRYHRFRVPAAMDGSRVVHRYSEVVMADDCRPINGTGGGAIYEIGEETIAFL